MDAYELADFIENGGYDVDKRTIAQTLRQLADRIKELEEKLERHGIQ